MSDDTSGASHSESTDVVALCHLSHRPEAGKEFTAHVNRISNSGNGIIEYKFGQINLGPVKKSIVNKTVVAVMRTPNFAECKSRKFLTDGYEEYLEQMYDKHISKEAEVVDSRRDSTPSSIKDLGAKQSTENKELKSNRSKGTDSVSISNSPFCPHCESMILSNKKEVCDSCTSRPESDR